MMIVMERLPGAVMTDNHATLREVSRLGNRSSPSDGQ